MKVDIVVAGEGEVGSPTPEGIGGAESAGVYMLAVNFLPPSITLPRFLNLLGVI